MKLFSIPYSIYVFYFELWLIFFIFRNLLEFRQSQYLELTFRNIKPGSRVYLPLPSHLFHPTIPQVLAESGDTWDNFDHCDPSNLCDPCDQQHPGLPVTPIIPACVGLTLTKSFMKPRGQLGVVLESTPSNAQIEYLKCLVAPISLKRRDTTTNVRVFGRLFKGHFNVPSCSVENCKWTSSQTPRQFAPSSDYVIFAAPERKTTRNLL